MPGAHSVDGHAVIDGVGHLAGDEAAPNQAVKAVLVGAQILFHPLRRQLDAAGPDGLMGVLGPGLGLIHPGLAGVVGLAVAGADMPCGGGQGLVADAEGIGTHIGDQAHGALPLDIDALIELLGDAHSPRRAHAKAAAGLLLQRGSDERGGGGAGLFAALHGGDGEVLPLRRGDNGIDLRLAVQFLFLPLGAVVAGQEHRVAAGAVQGDV